MSSATTNLPLSSGAPKPTGSVVRSAPSRLARRRWELRRLLWPAYKRLIQRSKWPVLAGPWRGEVGFEFLYWEPFLSNLDIPKERLIPITRGGSSVLYRADKAVELFAMRDPAAVRIENYYHALKEGELKQTGVSAFDRSVIADAAQTLGLGRRYHALHPAWMFAVTRPFLEGRDGIERLAQRHLRYYKWPAPTFTGEWPFPPEYVCVRFYNRPTFPLRSDTVQMAHNMVKNIAKRIPVVLLHSSAIADEHVDMPTKGLLSDRIMLLEDRLKTTVENNLAVQFVVLARSKGFFGTYGGLAQTALRLGVPSVSFYTEFKHTALAHQALSHSLAANMGVPLAILSLQETGMLQNLLT